MTAPARRESILRVLARFASRISLPAVWITGLALVTAVAGFGPPGYLAGPLFAGCVVLLFIAPRGDSEAAPVPVGVPVAGTWRALNSPGTKIPSHGVHDYAQTFAIDLVRIADEPEQGSSRRIRIVSFRKPREYPAFGAAVIAPVSGRVVVARDRWDRDHRSRDSIAGLAYFMIENIVRSLLGRSRVLGNHIVIDAGNSVYAVVAHLRRNSAGVQFGQYVRRGEFLAECGNSGNSTEPHVHFQLQDRPGAGAAGIPFRFESADGSDIGVPANGETIVSRTG
ncbi:M23 family metallopeptidase [Haloechinothrix sp. LS1_15]|uniref:M23 family metallopeptidase n=1 Tax=Haloechinothrix sp. LS1_15 TaxID=2652248 RepID=UPI00294AE73B|nr:M23 family metallopeptidase [Haloechinothrix sp. LS1_15]